MGQAIAWVLGIAALLGAIILIDSEMSKPSVDELNRIKQGLGEGCVFKDLGSYGKIDHVVMVQCEGKTATTTSSFDRHGKHSRDHNVAIEIRG